jgi:hypothetical protein
VNNPSHAVPLELLVRDFATGIAAVDATRPVWQSYQPGIGPHSEDRTVELVLAELRQANPNIYGGARLRVPYPASPRQRCDLVVPAAGGDWHMEVKLLRLLGDNGKPNDNMLMHILSPYPQHRSAVTDCQKLLSSGFSGRLSILIYGYDYPKWPTDIALAAFERLASMSAVLSSRVMVAFQDLVHPIHQRGIVAGWEISSLAGRRDSCGS